MYGIAATRQTNRNAGLARQRSQRRTRIDPATCERDYSQAELEFIHAIRTYQESTGDKFLTPAQVLHVLSELGYRKT